MLKIKTVIFLILNQKKIKVEKVINKFKRFERIRTKKNKNINTYMSFVYISSLINNINVNE